MYDEALEAYREAERFVNSGGKSLNQSTSTMPSSYTAKIGIANCLKYKGECSQALEIYRSLAAENPSKLKEIATKITMKMMKPTTPPQPHDPPPPE